MHIIHCLNSSILGTWPQFYGLDAGGHTCLIVWYMYLFMKLFMTHIAKLTFKSGHTVHVTLNL